MIFGQSSGALRAARFAEQHPQHVEKLALDAFVWTGKGAPTLEERRKNLPRYQDRPVDLDYASDVTITRTVAKHHVGRTTGHAERERDVLALLRAAGS